MKKKVLALSVIFLLTSIFITQISSVGAVGEGSWITGYSIYDAQTEQLLAQYNAQTNTTDSYQPILPGASIEIVFDVNIVASGSGDLKLTSGLLKPSSGPYWSLESDDYELGSSFSPNTASTKFNWVEGQFTMALYGKIPSSTNNTKSIVAISLFGPSGGKALDKIVITSTSAEMDNFLILLSEKEDKLQSMADSGVDPLFIEIYTNILNAAQDVASNGDVEGAVAMLDSLDTSGEPASSAMQMVLLPLVGVTAAIAVVFVVLFFRARGKVGYFQLVVEDQIKDLEGLSMRAARIDRSMAANLESVKDRLKRLVGM
ncbi:MAG: hypothetical protein NWE93_11455 [Candidatus Bathyarchaeota archaeon]|nr:hypothetical protein [Candidatus Bathyarchaeota archaeon]